MNAAPNRAGLSQGRRPLCILSFDLFCQVMSSAPACPRCANSNQLLGGEPPAHMMRRMEATHTPTLRPASHLSYSHNTGNSSSRFLACILTFSKFQIEKSFLVDFYSFLLKQGPEESHPSKCLCCCPCPNPPTLLLSSPHLTSHHITRDICLPS